VSFHQGEHGRDVGLYLRLELEERGEGAVAGRAADVAHLRGRDGGVRTGALLALVDTVGGICAGLAALPEGWVVSTNLAGRSVRGAHHGPLRLDANVLRRGRNNVVTSVAVHDDGADGAFVAAGVLTSAILVPEHGPPHWDRPLRFATGPLGGPPLPAVEEWLALHSRGDLDVEIDLADELRNPWGILHGGVVAMLVDLAAEHATGGVTTGAVLHFLSPNRVGPVRAHARPLGTRADGTVCRVEVHDGAPRLTALAVATARA
jgi:uncharacterized protein (TIGR00369 family)